MRQDAFKTYVEDMDKQFDKLIWGNVADHDGGYYMNAQHHRPTVHMPYRSEVCYEMLATPKTEDYIFE